jgi:hypothetical protein
VQADTFAAYNDCSQIKDATMKKHVLLPLIAFFFALITFQSCSNTAEKPALQEPAIPTETAVSAPKDTTANTAEKAEKEESEEEEAAEKKK